VLTVVNVQAATSSRLAYRGGPRSSSGSLAMLAAMRWASSLVIGVKLNFAHVP
jgi:hypothetical protein